MSGVISSNITWTLANSPYTVTGNILVNVGVTLTIEPGVSINVSGQFYIDIDGVLIAKWN